MMQTYSSSFSERVSSADVQDVDEKEGREEEEEEEEGKGVEDDGGEAEDVMMERREAVDEGTADLVRTLALLEEKEEKT